MLRDEIGFAGIVGQKHVTDSLKRILSSGKVTHAYVFSGPSGIGKRTSANAFACALLCENPGENGSCGNCRACMLLSGEGCLDLSVIKGDGKSIGIDEIRDMQSDLLKRPLYSSRKVCIICSGEKLTTEAQNCLLKTLENPPEYAVIIITTANYDALLPTIKSRTVRFNFSRNTREEVERIIAKEFGRNNADGTQNSTPNSMPNIKFLAAFADGAAGLALRLAKSEYMLEAREAIFDMVVNLRRERVGSIMEYYHIFEESKDEINDVFHILRLIYRDFMNMSVGVPESRLINTDKKDIILNNAAKFTAYEMLKNIEIIDIAERELKANANFETVIKVMLMKLMEEKHL